jgi:[ribosomal protein S18]-alanine N-acetyltransferase
MSIEQTAIRPLAGKEEIERCARIMAESEPWITLQRDLIQCRKIIRDKGLEKYGAYVNGEFAGFIALLMSGAFVGYVRAICVAPEFRGRGVGSALLRFAERRVFKESPNLFLCVSSFNTNAKRLYDRMGFKVVGELSDYIVKGYAELLLRKTIGPTDGFKPRRSDSLTE